MYKINETIPPQELLRPFFCPPQLNLYALRDPPVFSADRCSRHAIDCMDDGRMCCDEVSQRLRVGECLRCFQEARRKIRPGFEAKVQAIQDKMNSISEDYSKKLAGLVKDNKRIEDGLYNSYLKYEQAVQDYVAQSKKKQEEKKQSECCCSRKECRH